MIDPMGLLITEAGDRLQPSGDGGVAVPVRGRRYTGEKETPDEAAVPGDTPPYVLLRRLSRTRVGLHRQRLRVAGIAFANSPYEATQVALRLSAALHLIGPRLRANGVAIYHSREEIGGQPGTDPDTGWSTEMSIYIVHAPVETVASAS